MYDATLKDRVAKEVKARRKELMEKRRRRLMRVIVERYNGIQAGVARVVGISTANLASLLAGRWAIGEYLARKIELAIDLPWGWLDSDDPYLPKHLRPDPRPYSKPTGRPSKFIATLYDPPKHKRLESNAA